MEKPWARDLSYLDIILDEYTRYSQRYPDHDIYDNDVENDL